MSGVSTARRSGPAALYRAQRCLLLARTGPVEDRHRGLALFAVPLDAPGVRVRTIKSIDGKESFCEVFFDEVEVAQDDALGAPDEGWAAAIRVLAIERATNRMYRAWRFENELRHLIAACKTDPVLTGLLQERHYAAKLAETIVDIDVLKGHVETAVDALVAGEQIGARGSLAKLHWSEAHQRFAALAMEIAVEGIAAASARGGRRAAALRRAFICNRAPRRSTPAPPKFSSASSPIGSSNCREASEMATSARRNEGLSPAEFAATASRAVAACTGLSVAEQGARLAGDGLLGVVAAEDVGGLDLPLSFAVPVVAAASAGLLGFSACGKHAARAPAAGSGCRGSRRRSLPARAARRSPGRMP